MKNKNVRLITRTAILLALTIVFQTMARYLTVYMGPYNNFVVGPLVNACLIIAAAAAGIWGGSAVAVIAPFGAILAGANINPLFAPFIAIGNLLLVLCFCIAKKNRIAGLLAGSVLKFAFLNIAILKFVEIMKVPANGAKMMLFAFSWPQLVTALVGGVIALIVIRALKNQMDY